MTDFLTLHADPTSNLHAATKQYVDGVAQGLDIKESVVAATTAAITLEDEQTIDGVGVVEGDRVLVKDQDPGNPHAANGIYICVDSGAWTRSPDADTDEEVTSGMFCFVEEGTANGDTGWVLTTNDPITVGTTAIEFTQFSGAGTYTNGAGLLLSGNEFAVDFEDTNGNIAPIGTQDSGSSDKVARADHVHAHGDQAGGSLHSDVVAAGADGFMTGSDKTKLDSIDTDAEVNQFAFSNVDVDAATTVLAAEAKTDTLYVTGGAGITLTGTEGTDTLDIKMTTGTEDYVMIMGASDPGWVAHSFLLMSDTPSSWNDNYRVKVNGTALEFVNDTISNLEDVDSLVADAFAVVNGAGNAVTFVPATSTQGDIMYFNGTTWAGLGIGTEDHVLTSNGGAANPEWKTNPAGVTTWIALSDVDEADYSGHGNWLVRVNNGGTPDGLEFVDMTGAPSSATNNQTLYWNGSAWTASSIIYNDHGNAEVGINTATPNATLHVNGSISAKLITQTGDYDLDTGTNSDVYTILHNNTGQDNTITLPAVATYSERIYNIKKISGPTFKTIIATTDGTIDGASTYDLDQQYESVTVVSDGSNWHIV
jgi:hypothetical protein